MSEQSRPVFQSVEAVQAQFAQWNYIADRTLALTVKLAADLEKPLLLEGEAGVGKTEVAKVLASVLDTPLIRLQCYERAGRPDDAVRMELCQTNPAYSYG